MKETIENHPSKQRKREYSDHQRYDEIVRMFRSRIHRRSRDLRKGVLTTSRANGRVTYPIKTASFATGAPSQLRRSRWYQAHSNNVYRGSPSGVGRQSLPVLSSDRGTKGGNLRCCGRRCRSTRPRMSTKICLFEPFLALVGGGLVSSLKTSLTMPDDPFSLPQYLEEILVTSNKIGQPAYVLVVSSQFIRFSFSTLSTMSLKDGRDPGNRCHHSLSSDTSLRRQSRPVGISGRRFCSIV